MSDIEQDAVAVAIVDAETDAERRKLEAEVIEQTDNGPQPGDPDQPE